MPTPSPKSAKPAKPAKPGKPAQPSPANSISPPDSPLLALSPIDGRYHPKTAPLRDHFSEFALIRARVEVEIEWLIHLSQQKQIPEVPKFTARETTYLRDLPRNFSLADATRVKQIEADTNHDVKAVEYFIKEKIQEPDAPPALRAPTLAEFIHFACTSEDINNIAYALSIQRARETQILPPAHALLKTLRDLSHRHAAQPMLARTHGQPASPTTVGKEFATFNHRLTRATAHIKAQTILAKFNGASGNFNAHLAAYPDLDWQTIARAFVTHLGLDYQPLTTQIEPHDYIAELSHALHRLNTILIDLNRDLWGYIALGYFRQRILRKEVGSSAMPHKINPIDFENSEGNAGIANALLHHFAATLPISRWQRDLSDSTLLRNLGTAFAHTLLALQSTQRGLGKLQLNEPGLNQDLAENWEVLAEAIQTVLRRYGAPQPYETLKQLTRGTATSPEQTRAALHKLIQASEIPPEAKTRLTALTPADYIGIAAQLAKSPPPN